MVIWGYLGEKKEPHELAYMVDAKTDLRGELALPGAFAA